MEPDAVFHLSFTNGEPFIRIDGRSGFVTVCRAMNGNVLATVIDCGGNRKFVEISRNSRGLVVVQRSSNCHGHTKNRYFDEMISAARMILGYDSSVPLDEIILEVTVEVQDTTGDRWPTIEELIAETTEEDLT